MAFASVTCRTVDLIQKVSSEMGPSGLYPISPPYNFFLLVLKYLFLLDVMHFLIKY